MLLDRDDDGTEDAGTTDTDNVSVVDDAIERICNRIDGALGTRYVMPCAAISASPATPGQVSDLADLGVSMLLYEWLAPASKDAETYRLRFEGKDGDGGMLGRYRDGTETISGLSLVDGDEAYRPLTSESAGLFIAGRVDDDYTDDGTNRSDGFF